MLEPNQKATSGLASGWRAGVLITTRNIAGVPRCRAGCLSQAQVHCKTNAGIQVTPRPPLGRCGYSAPATHFTGPATPGRFPESGLALRGGTSGVLGSLQNSIYGDFCKFSLASLLPLLESIVASPPSASLCRPPSGCRCQETHLSHRGLPVPGTHPFPLQRSRVLGPRSRPSRRH